MHVVAALLAAFAPLFRRRRFQVSKKFSGFFIP